MHRILVTIGLELSLYSLFPQDFLRSLDPFRGRKSDELQTDLYNLSLDIEPKGAPPKAYPRSNKWNIAVVPQKVVSLLFFVSQRILILTRWSKVL